MHAQNLEESELQISLYCRYDCIHIRAQQEVPNRTQR